MYGYRIELSATSNVWQRGQRLHVTVNSAAFPTFACNPNTNAPPGYDATWQVAHNRVFHTSEWPSHLLAPVCQRG